MRGGQNSGFCKASLRTCYASLFECKGPWMLKTVINCHMRNRGLQNQTEKVPFTVLLNYLHTFVFNILSVFNTIYLINLAIGKFFYNIGAVRKSVVCNFRFQMLGVYCSCTFFFWPMIPNCSCERSGLDFVLSFFLYLFIYSFIYLFIYLFFWKESVS